MLFTAAGHFFREIFMIPMYCRMGVQMAIPAVQKTLWNPYHFNKPYRSTFFSCNLQKHMPLQDEISNGIINNVFLWAMWPVFLIYFLLGWSSIALLILSHTQGTLPSHFQASPWARILLFGFPMENSVPRMSWRTIKEVFIVTDGKNDKTDQLLLSS